MSAAESDTEVSAAEEPLVAEEEEAPPADPAPPAAPATLTLAELQQQVAELKVAHTKDVADLANRNKDLELELLRERDSRREAETQLLKAQVAAGSKGKEIDLDAETNWRKLEEYYDTLPYVPVSRFRSRIPFTGPDPRHLPENVDRPQAILKVKQCNSLFGKLAIGGIIHSLLHSPPLGPDFQMVGWPLESLTSKHTPGSLVGPVTVFPVSALAGALGRAIWSEGGKVLPSAALHCIV